ncbi:SGNH/GDSL hydrolase family protein [Neobacillus cucumis]|uniref:SGNH/GDSL hydrolase family protein n=1 Tax=Neobacillus cucumis TaxID=1740721 RepID=UPI0028533AD4|nr:SGNH/GDSL hydrolase family protein [Neobacillus cucumis]MDR4949936.1 SGNH/GDSL hydrolase family protein [Neobacillus cucumis]
MKNKSIIIFLSVLSCFLAINVIKDHSFQLNTINTTNNQKKQVLNVKKETKQKTKNELVYSPMGDSLTKGLNATKESNRYTAVLSQLIEKKFGYHVTQKGIYKSGSTLWQFGLPNYNLINKQNPDLITIEYGTNDLQLGKRYETPYLFKYNLLLLLNKIQKENRKIILVTTWNRGARSAPYDKVIKEVGQNRNIPVADISSVWKNRTDTYGPRGLKTPYGISDNFHPNNKGHKEIAEIIFKQVYQLYK